MNFVTSEKTKSLCNHIKSLSMGKLRSLCLFFRNNDYNINNGALYPKLGVCHGEWVTFDNLDVVEIDRKYVYGKIDPIQKTFSSHNVEEDDFDHIFDKDAFEICVPALKNSNVKKGTKEKSDEENKEVIKGKGKGKGRGKKMVNVPSNSLLSSKTIKMVKISDIKAGEDGGDGGEEGEQIKKRKRSGTKNQKTNEKQDQEEQKSDDGESDSDNLSMKKQKRENILNTIVLVELSDEEEINNNLKKITQKVVSSTSVTTTSTSSSPASNTSESSPSVSLVNVSEMELVPEFIPPTIILAPVIKKKRGRPPKIKNEINQ